MSAKTPFPLDTRLTAIAIAFRNPALSLIADLVLPRFTNIEGPSFKYMKRALAEHYTIPDTRVGRKSEPNRVEFTMAELPASVDDYGLDDIVPVYDKNTAPPGYDPESQATEGLTDLILLDREVRAAGLVFNAANYLAANKVTLSGTSQWSDYTNSDPIADTMAALDGPVVRPNTLVYGQASWSKLARHPKVVKAVNGNAGDSGIARRAQVAELFEVDQVLVGMGYQNTAKPGQTATLARCWGKHMAALHINPMATTTNGLSFGMTAQWGTRIAGVLPEPSAGLRGSQRVRVGESVVELILANECGYFIENAVA